MVTKLDEDMGRLFDLLRKLRIDKKTVVIFTSDNGPHREGGHDPGFFDSNGPLKGHKRDLYEGGIRVPLIVHWPGQIQPNSTSPAIVTGTDYYPTLLEMLNLPPLPDQHMDGRSFVPALKAEDYDRGPIYWHFPNTYDQPPYSAVRKGDWKLIYHHVTRKLELFNLKDDPRQSKDLYAEHPDKVASMRNLLHRYIAGERCAPSR